MSIQKHLSQSFIFSLIFFSYPLSCYCEQHPVVAVENTSSETHQVASAEKQAEPVAVVESSPSLAETVAQILNQTENKTETQSAETTLPAAVIAQAETPTEPAALQEEEPVSSFVPIDKVASDYLLTQREKTDTQPSYATTTPAETTPAELASRMQIGGNYTRVSFKPHEHQTFTGNLGGMQALYEYNPLNCIYGAVKFVWRQGMTHAPTGKRSFLYFDIQERLGYTFASSSKDWQTTFFTGFGYHRVGQKFHPKEGDSVRFNYNTFYFPVGTLNNYDFTSCFGLGMNVTWMPQIYPTVAIIPLKGSRWDLTKRLVNFYAEMPLTYTVTENRSFQIILNPFYERWQDGHTTAKLSNGTRLGVPGNTYNFYGAELNFAYRF